MATSPIDSSFYADPQGVNALRRDARANDPAAVKAAARQFEALFTSMMLKSMRDATPKGGLFDSDQQDFYQDMFDQQLATQLSKGKGLGLADSLVQQLMRTGLEAPAKATPPTTVASETGSGSKLPRNADDSPSFKLFGIKAGGGWAGADARAFATALQQGGYATDPGYVTKLTSVAEALKSSRDLPLT